jgi:hypothetical protein
MMGVHQWVEEWLDRYYRCVRCGVRVDQVELVQAPKELFRKMDLDLFVEVPCKDAV